MLRWGYISEKDLQNALETQRQTHQRIDQILVEKGVVTRAVVDSEARRQMEQIVFSTLSWPDGSFHFQRDTGPADLDVAVSLSAEMIIEGIRRIPESEQFLELLGDLSAVPTLTRDPMSSVSLRLLRDAVRILSQIDGKTDVASLLKSASSSPTASAKILYSLLFAGIIEMRSRKTKTPSGPPEFRLEPRRPAPHTQDSEYVYDLRNVDDLRKLAAPAPAPISKPVRPTPAASEAFQGTKQLALDTYRQLDWLSHYDLLGVSRKATAKEIEEAFRERSRLFDPSLKAHPELIDCWRQLTVLSKWLRVAYDVLSNSASREAYDRKIDEATPSQPAPEPGKSD